MEDILYYSNHCNYSQKVLQYIYKNNLIEKISCICIDQRSRDSNNNTIKILLENGKSVYLPPSIQTVPTVLRKRQNHTLVLGCSEIINMFQNEEQYANLQQKQSTILQRNLEPVSSYGLSSNNFMEINEKSAFINAPDENYESGKLSGDRIDMLIKERNDIKFLPL